MKDTAIKARQLESLGSLINKIPYAKFLGIQAKIEGDEIGFHLPPSRSHIGNPTLPAMHGGAMSGFMELSAVLHLLYVMEAPKIPKVVDFSIEYVRAGVLADTFARCEVVRQGRKLALVAVTCWQADEKKPIATARVHFLLQ